MTVSDLLEQPRNKYDNINKLVNCKLLTACFKLVDNSGQAVRRQLCWQLKAFFNTMDWWGICPTGPLPLPHHWRNKMAYCPKARALRPVSSKWVRLTLKRSLKDKICWWLYLNLCCVWMFSMQFITNFTIKTLFWEAEIFLMCSQNAGNAISETQILKISWGACPQTPLTNSCLRLLGSHLRSLHTILGEGKEKMGPLAVLPHHWRILSVCTCGKPF
jgi:hypothetical protein